MSRTTRKRNPRVWEGVENANRDFKGERPPSHFKKMTKKSRKAKERNAMRHLDVEEQEIPKFKKSDWWLWR